MTQEEKQLLLKDLCARLPYRVRVKISDEDILSYDSEKGTLDGKETVSDDNFVIKCDRDSWIISCDDFKPYLRPMSSMMQGEWEEMTALIYPYGRVNRNPDNKNELLLWLSAEENEMPIILMNNVFSWLNSHHFDYRGLIEKGLALEAPEEMYNTK